MAGGGSQMHAAWYYAEKGESRGPFSFEQMGQHLLSVQDPQRLLVWRHGLVAWTAALEVPELAAFTSRPPPVPPALTQETNVSPPELKGPDSSLRTAFFSFNGRMGRTEYVGVLIASFVAFIIVVAAVESIPDAKDDPLLNAGVISAALLFMWVRLASSSKRFHDYNRSGWSCLGLAVPLLNVFLFFELLLKKGSPEANDYGPPQSHF
ncbi:hypothetical protein BDS110ZK14_32050 [Bradyrhizobium diazoefficiens]|nr:hypothetical protein XF15B_76970 [Bradyrhizobium diazoefficiens]